MKRVVLPLVAVMLWVGAVGALGRYREARGVKEYMSLPPVHTARMVGAGFDNVLADSLFVQFLSYFGRHMFKDHRYFNMAPVLELATDLDPDFEAAYAYGAMALGDNGQLDEAIALYDKGVRRHPDDWHYAYSAGMNLFLFAKDDAHFLQAAGYFKRAAALRGAPPEAHYMEARAYDVTHRKPMLIAAWLGTYRNAPDKQAREVARRALERLGVKPDLK